MEALARQAAGVLRGAGLALAGFPTFALAFLFSIALSPAARAQQVELEPSAVAACLQAVKSDTELPAYPFAAYKLGASGRVQVELHFTGPDLRPAVEVLSQEGDAAFVDAVRTYARGLRVPCLPAGQQVRLRQEYVFRPGSGDVVWSRAEDTQDTVRREQLKCLRQAAGQKLPDYPEAARRSNLQGRVLAQVTFTGDDTAPQIKLHHRPVAEPLAAPVRAWLQGVRLPCHTGGALTANYTFVFRLGDDVYGFKPMSLVQFIGVSKDWRRRGIQLDTRNMGCPFDVRLVYQQPYLPNTVGVSGKPDATRQPLLDWLAAAELDLKSTALDSVYADTADIHVPCVNLDVRPDGT